MRLFRVAAAPGHLAMTWMPGRAGDYAGDVAALVAWRPGLVISMVPLEELARHGAAGLAHDLAAADIAWAHVPVADFGGPDAEAAALWPGAAAAAHGVLDAGGLVVAHCRGGCGRSGMAVLRLLVERGEAPETALARLRAKRDCAVESPAQFAWASGRR